MLSFEPLPYFSLNLPLILTEGRVTAQEQKVQTPILKYPIQLQPTLISPVTRPTPSA